MADSKRSFDFFGVVKGLSLAAMVFVVAYKIYETPVDLTVDFPTLLSLLLAMFSVGLAALFYFKATETSNTFYDNTYKFTQDVASLLAKIESGFGERLRHLDEGYSSMREQIQRMPTSTGSEVEDTKRQIEEEKIEIEKVLAERNEIIEKLVARSQLQAEEKDEVLSQLRSKEQELEKAQKDLNRMNRRLTIERVRSRQMKSDGRRDDLLMDYLATRVIPTIGAEKLREAPPSVIRRSFDRIAHDFPRAFLKDLERAGLYDGGITMRGVSLLRELADEDA
jgi:hypothetical protein